MKKLLSGLCIFVFGLSAVLWYTSTQQDQAILDKIESLGGNVANESLHDLVEMLEWIEMMYEVWSMKQWYATNIKTIFEWILVDRILGDINNKEREVQIKKLMPEKNEPIPVEPPPPANTYRTSELSQGDFDLLMNHVDPIIADHEIVILEFTDLQCPFCKRHHQNETLQKITATYPEVSYATLAFPLSFHQNAQWAAEAMNCVHRVAGYGQAMIYKDISMETWLWDVDDITDSVYDMGLNSQQESEIFSCMRNGDTKNAVKQQMDLWQGMWVTGTPGNIVLHMPTKRFVKISGAVPESAFTDTVEAMLAGDRSEFEISGVSPSYVPSPTPAPKPAPSAPILEVLTQSEYDTFLDTAYIRGNKDAAVSIIEFSDVQCPFCQRHTNNGTLDQVQDTYGDEVNIIFAHFPLSFHQNAQKAGEALECAGKLWWEEWFYAFKKAYFAAWGDSNMEIAKEAAMDVGLDDEVFIACVESGEFAQKVKDQMAFGRLLWVTGTPGNIVVNNTTLETIRVSGAVPATSFDTAIKWFLWIDTVSITANADETVISKVNYSVEWETVSIRRSESSDQIANVEILLRHQSESSYTQVWDLESNIENHSFSVDNTWNYFLKIRPYNGDWEKLREHIQTVKVNDDMLEDEAPFGPLLIDTKRRSAHTEPQMIVSEIWTQYIEALISKAFYDDVEIGRYKIYYAKQSLYTQKLSLIKDVVVDVDQAADPNYVSLRLDDLDPDTTYYLVAAPVHPTDPTIEPLEFFPNEVSATTES